MQIIENYHTGNSYYFLWIVVVFLRNQELKNFFWYLTIFLYLFKKIYIKKRKKKEKKIWFWLYKNSRYIGIGHYVTHYTCRHNAYLQKERKLKKTERLLTCVQTFFHIQLFYYFIYDVSFLFLRHAFWQPYLCCELENTSLNIISKVSDGQDQNSCKNR